VLEAGLARPRHALLGPAGLVLPVQGGKDMANVTLHAKRHPGDSRLPQFGERAGIDRFRVGLDGDLGVASQPEFLPDRRDDPADLPRWQQRGRAAAEEDRLDWSSACGFFRCTARQDPPGQRDLLPQRARVGLLRRSATQLSVGIGVEVTVTAACPAEWDVDVDAKRPHPEVAGRGLRQGPVIGRRVAVWQG
jgi:hypothetical protein